MPKNVQECEDLPEENSYFKSWGGLGSPILVVIEVPGKHSHGFFGAA